MKNKRIILCLAAAVGFCVLGAGSAKAAVWYVRDGGGNPTQCTGTANAVYPGSGSGKACAFNHPRYAIGYCTGNESSGAPCQYPGVMSAGDTLYIDGDSDINSGQQAQYEMGYDDTGAGLTPGCSTSYPYACTSNNIPAGLSTAQRTSIIGTGTHKPQLWGTQRTSQVFYADNSHILLQWLEITDHDACAYNDPASGCNYNGPYPFGQWAVDGLFLGGDDVNVTDVYIHGLGRYGINSDNFGSAAFTRVYVIGNGFGGVSTGTAATITGTLTWNQPIIEWNGCVESYPLTGVIDNPSNYSHCFGQDSGGYGDGLAFGNTGHGNAGNWTIIGPGSISFNTQDGLDTLHGTGNGVIQVDKMRFEGNAGDQVKANALDFSLTNSVVIGDCGWWLGAPQSYSGFQLGDICRANGDVVIFNVTNGSTSNIYNNTILSNGNIALESDDAGATGCNSSTKINVNNNIVLGGYVWGDDTSILSAGGNSQTTYIYNDGSDGNGAGTCGNLTWNENYNIVTGTRNNNQGCVGSNDKCGTNPGFANSVPMGTAGGAVNTFYQGNAAETLVSLSSSSPAIAAGSSGLTYWNNGNDYHNQTRTSPPSIGGLEANSCAANGVGCFYNSDCCGGTCSVFFCGASNSTPQPVVAITSPSGGSSFSYGSNISITATASEANGTISNISIYNGSTLLGSSSTSPYTYIMVSPAVGTYTLKAVATDAKGVSTISSLESITVQNASILPSSPVVTITSPSSGSSYTAGSSITITTTASETSGTIRSISLYNGSGVLLGTSNTSPYNYVYTNILAGSYSFYAVATDINGVSTTSSAISITVPSAVTITNLSIVYPVGTAGQIVDSISSAQALTSSNVTVQVAAASTPSTWYALSGDYAFISNGNNKYTVSFPATDYPAYMLVKIANQSPQKIVYTVNISAGSGGTISPIGLFNYNSGASQTITVTPNTGYTANLTVDGSAVTLTNNAYVLSNIASSHVVVASFVSQTKINQTITASAGSGGKISPTGSVSVPYGTNQAFTITPNVGYTANLTIDGTATILAGNAYTFSNVTNSHTISVSFVPFTITYPASLSGQVTVNFSSNVALTNSNVVVQVATPSAPNTWYTLSGNYSFVANGNNHYTVLLPASGYPSNVLVNIIT